MKPQMPKFIRYRTNQLHTGGTRQYNWASSWSRVPVDQPDETSSSEDDIILTQRPRSDEPPMTPIKRKILDRGNTPQTPSTCASSSNQFSTPGSPAYWTSSSESCDVVIIERPVKRARSSIPIIEVESSDGEETRERNMPSQPTTPTSPTSKKLLCSVRGCLKLFSNHQRFIEHVFDKHSRSSLGLELRDLGWQPVSINKQNPIKELRTLCGIGNLALALSKFLKVNPKNAKIPIQATEATELRSSIDPAIASSLLIFCEMREDGIDPRSKLIGALTSINDFIAYILFQAEEITLPSKRRLLRYFSLIRDILQRSSMDECHLYTWNKFKHDVENKLTDEVIETVVKKLPMSQLILLATPATPTGAKRAIIAIKRFLLLFASKQI